MIKDNCDFCNKEILVREYLYKKLKHHFCNRGCFTKYQRINPIKYWSGKKISEETKKRISLTVKNYLKGKKLYNEIDLSNKKELILELYKKGFSLGQIASKIGVSTNTVKRKMIKWEIPRRKPLIDKEFYRAEDGHLVKSGMELEVDNWLFNNGIIHTYEKNLGETRFKCDFYIPRANCYIEVFGLTIKSYRKRVEKKIELYKRLGLHNLLVGILPKDKIEDKLRFLLNVSEIQRRIEQYEK